MLWKCVLVVAMGTILLSAIAGSSLAAERSLLLSSANLSNRVAQTAAVNVGHSACEDSLYLQLLKKPLDQMSEREYEYFVRKDKECDQYRATIAPKATQEAPQPIISSPGLAPQPAQQGGMSGGVIILISILGTVVFLVLLGALAS